MAKYIGGVPVLIPSQTGKHSNAIAVDWVETYPNVLIPSQTGKHSNQEWAEYFAAGANVLIPSQTGKHSNIQNLSPPQKGRS